MKTMKRILLVFDDEKEMNFMEANLKESGFQIYSSSNVKDILGLATQVIPDLIVLNTLDTAFALAIFNSKLKTEQLKNTIVISMVDPKDYLSISDEEYFIVKPIRPKLLLSLIRGLMNHEAVSWLPNMTHVSQDQAELNNC
jgi:DNA-binding NtrC family response regulator